MHQLRTVYKDIICSIYVYYACYDDQHFDRYDGQHLYKSYCASGKSLETTGNLLLKNFRNEILIFYQNSQIYGFIMLNIHAAK